MSEDAAPFSERLHREVRLLYTGRSRRATAFRYALIAFDVFSIGYFILTAAMQPTGPLIAMNTLVGVLILADFAARLWIAENRWRMLRQVYTLADVIVVASLLLLPLFTHEVAFLRILRGLRLIHSYHLLRDLRNDIKFFRRHEDAVLAAVNLMVFIFVTTSFVFVLHFDQSAGYSAYIDALYFTVATLTTTGFGDITMGTPTGKLLSVFIMIVGVALFLRLAQAIFQPSKVKFRCPTCGLNRHEPDAIHCKHCGEPIAIETEGTT